jgi:hypothetical protein
MAITIINKGDALPPQRPNKEEMWVDQETGLIHWPESQGKAPEPLNGPTTGAAYEDLKEREKEFQQLNLLLKRQMLSTYQCVNCHQKTPGKLARIRRAKIDGVETDLLVCPRPRCDGPLIMIEDAADLRSVPGGRV